MAAPREWRSALSQPANMSVNGSSRWLPTYSTAAVATASALVWAVRIKTGAGGPQLAQQAEPPPPAATVAVPPRTPSQTEELFVPLVVKTVVVGQRDGGVVVGPNARPVRRVQYDMVDRMEWSTRSGQGRYIVTRPRREMLLVSTEAF